MLNKMRISLVQTSQDRKSKLARFVKSLNAQEGVDFSKVQLIFVDQGDNRDVFNGLDERIEFTYIKYERCSLSHARNVALNHVNGEYVGFPDDDCWYEPDVLRQVLGFFAKGCAGVIAKGTNENGQSTNNFPDNARRLTLYNHCGAISYTIFVKYVKSITFDENIGVGSPYKLSSGEETDYLINVMLALGTEVYYEPGIVVHHPLSDKGNFKDNEAKQYQYARGWGYVLRKHHYPLSIILRSFIRPMGGIILSLLRLDTAGARHSFCLLKGRIEGYFYKIQKRYLDKTHSIIK